MDHRIDKYLWCIRVFKPDPKPQRLVRGNKVQVNGNNSKPSKLVKPGDEITVAKARPTQLSS